MKMSKEDTVELTKFKDLFPDIKDTEKLLTKTPAEVSKPDSQWQKGPRTSHTNFYAYLKYIEMTN